MSAETSEKPSVGINTGLKPKEVEVLSMMILCSPPETQASCLASVDFKKLAIMGSYKSAHAAKTSVGILIKKLKANSPNPENGDAPTPTTPKKRKSPVKKAATTEEGGAESPAKKPRGRPKKSATPAPAAKDEEETKVEGSENVGGQDEIEAK